ncbi:MAG: hypothetical protein HKO53_12375 [Gemmatimonadetes bacterium]|nr:hypothetical protein [Gemmatimonadota bacterium]
MRWPALLALLLFSVGSAAAQDPWEGWFGPPSDGIYGVRFGMDRTTVDALFQKMGLRQATARPGTMRHVGKLEGHSAEVVTEFEEDLYSGVGGRLYRIRITWPDLRLRAGKALQWFDRWDRDYAERYGPPRAQRDPGRSNLVNAVASYLRLYQGTQMQAILELKAPKPGRLDLILLLDSPQLHPALPGYGSRR